MRVLKIIAASLIAVVALLALASGFVVVAAVGAVVVLLLILRRILTGKPMGSGVRFEVRRNPPRAAPRKFDGADVIDIDATPSAPPSKSLEN